MTLDFQLSFALCVIIVELTALYCSVCILQLAGAHSYVVVSSCKCKGKNSCHDLIPNPHIYAYVLKWNGVDKSFKNPFLGLWQVFTGWWLTHSPNSQRRPQPPVWGLHVFTKLLGTSIFPSIPYTHFFLFLSLVTLSRNCYMAQSLLCVQHTFICALLVYLCLIWRPLHFFGKNFFIPIFECTYFYTFLLHVTSNIFFYILEKRSQSH